MTIKKINSISVNIRRITVLILLFGFLGFNSFGQGNRPPADSLRQYRNSDPVMSNRDTIRIADEDSVVRKINMDEMDHSPKRAMIYGLVLPGLGQAYNKKYWKIPIVYGAIGGVGYWVYYNTQGYRQISQEYTDDPNSTNERYLRLWRRQLELSYISLVGAYALQVLDAYVDAYLFYWDVSPDLTLRMTPSFDPINRTSGVSTPYYGFKCKLTF